MPTNDFKASLTTWLDFSVLGLLRSFRDSALRARPQPQARWSHPSRQVIARLQQMSIGGILAFFVLALLYLDSGSSRHGPPRESVQVKRVVGVGAKEPLQQLDRSPGSVAATQEEADCRALSRLQICSHRASLGLTENANDMPLIQRMLGLAVHGIPCYDLDVVTTADSQLVVGHPAQIAARLRSAGRLAPSGQVEAVPWSDFVAAGLDQWHPLLTDVLAAFAKIAVQVEVEAAAAEAAEEAEAGGVTQAEGGGAEDAGRGHVQDQARGGGGGGGEESGGEAQRQGVVAAASESGGAMQKVDPGEEQQQQQEQQGGKGKEQSSPPPPPPPPSDSKDVQRQVDDGKGQAAASDSDGQRKGSGRRLLVVKDEQAGGGAAAAAAGDKAQREEPHPGQEQSQEHQHKGRRAGQGPPLLLLELKDAAMRVAAAEAVANISRALGVEQRVGLWLPRVLEDLPVVQEVGAFLRRSEWRVLRVLGLPDRRYLPNGTFVATAPSALQPDDAALYDIFGPSSRLPDAALAEVAAAAAAGARRVVAWVVDTAEEATRLARLGVDAVVTNDPVGLGERLHLAIKNCQGA